MKLLRALYSFTIFLSAFLLFAMEPMAAKQLLPTLGGSSAVWTTCLVFFSVALLLGYLYAHWIASMFTPTQQAVMHILLLTLAIAVLGIHVKPDSAAVAYHPALTVFRVLATVTGLPYLALSATTPLLTAWYADSFEGRSPYRLFALSNTASLLALACYPLLIEPHMSMNQQTAWWSTAFVLFAVLCGAIAWQGRRRVPVPRPISEERTAAAPEVFWFLLAMGGGMLLTSVTSHMSENIAAIPLLWIPPLALYLLTFILAFQGAWAPLRHSLLRLVLVAVASLTYVLRDIRTQWPIMISVPLFLVGLFVICFFLHGELYARRPGAAGLTRFYLVASAGGAAGTLLVGVVAPLVLRANYDLACVLVVVALIALAATWHDGWGMRMIWAVGVVAAVVVLGAQIRQYDDDAVALMRSFYGTLRVRESHVPPQSDTDRQLLNGTIEHGAEWFAPQFRGQPLTYYATDSGLGLAMRLCCAGPKRVGVIGLGTGTVAAYGNAGDLVRFYEINPSVERLARHWFTYLHDSPAQTEVVLGDARLSLAAEAPEQFNVIVVDAFSGDAIPVHLLTREALALYRRHLMPGGIIAFHVSNQYIDLEPVVAAIASDAGLEAVSVHSHGDQQNGLYFSDWILVTANQSCLRQPEIVNNGFPTALRRDVRLWTDNYSSVFPLLKWNTR